MSRPFSVVPMHPGSLLGEDEIEAICGSYFSAFETIGGKRRPADDYPDNGAPLFLLVATGGSEEVILKWWANRPQTMAGEPLYLIANPAQLDPKSDTLWLAHCTVPRTLVESYRLRSHFESGLGVGIQGKLSEGPVTLLRIGGKGLDRVWLAEGEILQSGNAENLCRTQVEIRLTHGGKVTDLLRAPLGNHLVLAPGHHIDRLERWLEYHPFFEGSATTGGRGES